MSNDVTGRFAALESSVAVLDSKMDNANKLLDDVKTILNKFLILEERQTNFHNDFVSLKNEHKIMRDEVIKTKAMIRTIFLCATIFLSTIIGLSLYIYQDKIAMLEKHEQLLVKNNNK